MNLFVMSFDYHIQNLVTAFKELFAKQFTVTMTTACSPRLQ